MKSNFEKLISPESKFCRASLNQEKSIYSEQTFFNDTLPKNTEVIVLGKLKSKTSNEIKYLVYVPIEKEYLELNESEISFDNNKCFMFELPFLEELGEGEEKKQKVLAFASNTKITKAKMRETLYDDYSTDVLIEKESVVLVLGAWVKETDFGSNSGFAVLDFEKGICLSLDSSYLEIIDKGIVPKMPEIHPQ